MSWHKNERRETFKNIESQLENMLNKNFSKVSLKNERENIKQLMEKYNVSN